MYGILTSVELGMTLILLLLSWTAGSKASALVYCMTTDRLRRRIHALSVWSVLALFAALIVLSCYAAIAMTHSAFFWKDRLYVNGPLIAVPLSFVWLYALPRLWAIRKHAKAQDASSSGSASTPSKMDIHMRVALASPGVVLPFQASAIGAVTAFYFIMLVPFPFRPLQAAIPLFFCLAAIVGLWILHDRRWQRASRPDADFTDRHWQRRGRSFAVFCAGVMMAGIIIFFQSQNSRWPDEFNMAASKMDFCGIAIPSYDTAQSVSVAALTGPTDRKPDRRIRIVAERRTVQLASGKQIDAWTFNGQIPGPELRFKQGELVEVTLINRDIDIGVTIHWHGLDVPNAEDGVPGATQNAVMPGQSHTYRFLAEQVGTFWYHSHQHSRMAVERGLFGPLIIEPADGTSSGPSVPRQDFTVITHTWDRTLAIGNTDGIRRESAAPGTEVTLRLIHTDDWVRQQYALAGADFRVTAIDGTPLNEPDLLRNTELQLTTGGRYDVTFTMPDHPVFLRIGGASSKVGLLISPHPEHAGEIPEVPAQTAVFDPTRYGKPAFVPFDADSTFDRHFLLVLDNKWNYFNGKFSFLYTINGEVFPRAPMFVVRENELIKTTIVNRGHVDHPMHLHGHHMLVLSRNGKPVNGSPWWSDTLDVQPGDIYEVAFRADNPGVWMNHCHNLAHAEFGMTMHLMYEGVHTPFTIGSSPNNYPE